MLSRADYIDSQIHIALKASAKGQLIYNTGDEINLLADRFQSLKSPNDRSKYDRRRLEQYSQLMSWDNDSLVKNNDQQLKDCSTQRESFKATSEVRRFRNALSISNQYERQGQEFQTEKEKAFADFDSLQSKRLQEKVENTESAASLLKRIQAHKSTKADAEAYQIKTLAKLEWRSDDTQHFDHESKEAAVLKETLNANLEEEKLRKAKIEHERKLEAEKQEKLRAQELERQKQREKEQATARQLEKQKAESNAGLLRLKTMLDIIQKDMKLNEKVLSLISSQTEQFKSQVNEDDFFQLQLQIAKQALSNMCEIVKFSQQYIQGIKEESVDIVKKYSKEVNNALRDVQSLVDLAENERRKQIEQQQINKDTTDSIPVTIETRTQHAPEQKTAVQGTEKIVQSSVELKSNPTSSEVTATVLDVPQISVVSSKTSTLETTKRSTNGGKLSQFCASKTEDLYKKYEQMLSSPNSLTKLFLKNVKGAANSMRNSLSANSKENLLYQRKRIVSLFQGQTIVVSDVTVDPTRMENGTEVVRIIIAESLISNLQQFHKRDLALASLLVELALVDPLFQDTLIAAFHRKCPFTRPDYPVKKHGQTEDDFMLEMGYVKQLGDWEDSKSYLNRMLSMVQLYSAVLTCRPINNFDQSARHPYGYAMAWSWLAEFINMEPFSGFSAGILRAFLAICGRDLLYQYGIQFRKLMRMVYGPYLDKCKKIGDDLVYVGNLENSLQSFFSSGKFFQDCELDEDFWN